MLTQRIIGYHDNRIFHYKWRSGCVTNKCLKSYCVLYKRFFASFLKTNVQMQTIIKTFVKLQQIYIFNKSENKIDKYTNILYFIFEKRTINILFI